MDSKLNQVKQNMIETIGDAKVLLACSTGIDSMVLLNLLMDIIPLEKIVIAHVNHQKRIASNTEEAFIINYAKTQGLKCYTTKLPHYEGSNFQNWARNKRYEFFLNVATLEKIKLILLAHHANDNIETILERLIRSSSLEGYAGIRKEVSYHNVNLYRPLLDVSKDDIITFAKERNITYFDDESNFSNDYLRNRIRHNIVPFLEKENPSLVKAINNFSNTLFGANDFIENYETNFIKREVLVYNNNKFAAKINLQSYKQETPFIKMQVLFRLLKPFRLSKECILDLIKQIDSPKNKIVKKVNQKLLMIKEYDYVIFTDNLKAEDYYLKITSDGLYDLPNNAKLEVKKNICNFITSNGKICYNINRLPIVLRTRKNGDKIRTKCGSVSISDFLTNKKIPYLQRLSTLVLCDSDDMPVAILGYKIK